MVVGVLLVIGLVVYAFIDCVQTPGDELRRRRSLWLAVIALVPVLGAVAWLTIGRGRVGDPGAPRRHQRVAEGPDRADGYGWTAEGAAEHPIGPDDDPDFLQQLRRPIDPDA